MSHYSVKELLIFKGVVNFRWINVCSSRVNVLKGNREMEGEVLLSGSLLCGAAIGQSKRQDRSVSSDGI